MGLLTVGKIYSLSGYVQHVCQLLGISHFNAGALVFCDGRTKHEVTRDTESTLWFFRIPILLDFMMQSITLTGLTRLLTVLLWLVLICNMIDAERMGLGFDPSYCASSFFLFLASIHMSYMTSLSGTRQFVYMQFGYTLYWICMVIQYQLSMLLFSDDITLVMLTFGLV